MAARCDLTSYRPSITVATLIFRDLGLAETPQLRSRHEELWAKTTTASASSTQVSSGTPMTAHADTAGVPAKSVLDWSRVQVIATRNYHVLVFCV